MTQVESHSAGAEAAGITCDVTKLARCLEDRRILEREDCLAACSVACTPQRHIWHCWLIHIPNELQPGFLLSIADVALPLAETLHTWDHNTKCWPNTCITGHKQWGGDGPG